MKHDRPSQDRKRSPQARALTLERKQQRKLKYEQRED